MYSKKRLSLAVSAALGFTGMVAAGTALAQDQQDAEESDALLEEVIVTGSRIVSEDGFGRTSPVTVVGMEEIDSYGLTRVEDFAAGDAGEALNLTRGLLSRGYSDDEIAKIWSRNFLRVLDAAEAAAVR